MRKFTVSGIAYLAMFLALVVLMPWGVSNTSEFDHRAVLAVIVSVSVYFFVRYGLMFALRTRWVSGLASRSAITTERSQPGKWRFVRIGTTLALLIGFAGISLAKMRVVTQTEAFLITAICQQVVFITLELLISRKFSKDSSAWSYTVITVAVIGIATLFARFADITLMAQQPPVYPLFPVTTNMLFAIPVIALGLVCIMRKFMAKSV